MKKQFEKLREDLQMFDNFSSNLQNLQQMSAALPAMSSFAGGLFSSAIEMVYRRTRQTYDVLDAFLANKGPEAEFARKLQRHTVFHQQAPGTTEDHIRDMYPPQYAKEHCVNPQTLLNGMIQENGNTGYTDSFGARWLDIGDRDEKIDLAMSSEYWDKAPTPIFEVDTASNTIVNYMPEAGWGGKVTAKLIYGTYNPSNKQLPLVVEIKHGNGSVISLLYTLSYQMEDGHGRSTQQLRLSYSGPMGWNFADPRFLNKNGNCPSPKDDPYAFIGEVYNAYESENYPITRDFVNHQMVKTLFRKMLEDMGVDPEDKVNQHWTDPKVVYQHVKELLDKYRVQRSIVNANIADQCVTADLYHGSLREAGWGGHYCEEYDLVDTVGVSGEVGYERIHPKGDFKVHGKVLHYYDRYTTDLYNGYNVALVLDDRTEEARMHVFYASGNNVHDLKCNLTGRTVKRMMASLEIIMKATQREPK